MSLKFRVIRVRGGTRRSHLAALALLLGSMLSLPPYAMAEDGTAKGDDGHMQREKAAVLASFEDWENGVGHPGDLLAEDAVWTLTGASCLARTYYGLRSVEEDLADLIRTRMSEPIVPEVHEIHQEGNTVVVRFTGRATALDGIPYTNDYAWFLTFDGDEVVRLVAFLDANVLIDLIHRIPLPAESKGSRVPEACMLQDGVAVLSG